MPYRFRTVCSFILLGLVTSLLVLSRAGGELGAGGKLTSTGSPQLVSFERLPEMDGEMCDWVPASSSEANLVASLQRQSSTGTSGGGGGAVNPEEASKRPPVRVIKDPYSVYSAVAVDPIRNEVVMTDENLFQILVYDRLTNTPPTAMLSEPKRVIGGLNSHIEYQCGVYVDPATGDIYAVNNDTMDELVIFSREVRGNMPPSREIHTPHTTFGIAVDEEERELFLTVQDDAAIVVYDKTAKGEDAPLRNIQGERTLLADPHGIALDPRNGLLFVTNWGSKNAHRAPDEGPILGSRGQNEDVPNWPVGRLYSVPGSGKINPPSITVYPKNARGDVPPLRVISGSRTQLDWPTGITYDPKRDEIFVANDTGDSVLVFSAGADGNTAPTRLLKGPKSMIKNPTGVFIDAVNDELFTANFGNHTVTVHKPNAAGDAPPLRVIRSAPIGAPTPSLSNPHPVAYDSKREEILVPS